MIAQKTLEDLGWSTLVDHWAKRCATKRGEAVVRANVLFDAIDAARERAAEISEARELAARDAALPLGGISDITGAIARVRKGGVVVLPSDEPLLRPHLPAADRGLSVLRFGPDASADVRILDVQQRETTRAKILAAAYGELDVELQTVGLHNARNAAAAIAVGMWLELPAQPVKTW